ncbi:hypothetical protein L1887_28173 [Cichorium endivia]|nr:hypothetical protein L1887_28173 [Cichorium endivia]
MEKIIETWRIIGVENQLKKSYVPAYEMQQGFDWSISGNACLPSSGKQHDKLIKEEKSSSGGNSIKFPGHLKRRNRGGDRTKKKKCGDPKNVCEGLEREKERKTGSLWFVRTHSSLNVAKKKMRCPDSIRSRFYGAQ